MLRTYFPLYQFSTLTILMIPRAHTRFRLVLLSHSSYDQHTPDELLVKDQRGFLLFQVGVRQAALELLQDALEGSGGGGAVTAYTEALRIIMKLGATDKSAVVRAAAAGCLRAFAVAGGQGLGVGGLENCATVCLKV